MNHLNTTEQEVQDNLKSKSRPKTLSGKLDKTIAIYLSKSQLINSVVLLLLFAVAGIKIYQTYFAAPDGKKLVNTMIASAGGIETWQKINQGSFVRTHKLYSEKGDLVSQKIEKIYFDKTNGKISLMIESNQPDQSKVTIGKDASGYWALKDGIFKDAKATANDLGMMCDSKWCQPDCNMQMAFYRFSMPFKLVDNGVIAQNAGRTKVLDKEYQLLNISYKPEVGKDKWVFLVDPQTNLIAKMEYHHKGDMGQARPEEFYWSDYKNIDGLNIAQKWKRYWSNGKTLEEYNYSDFEFKNNLPKQFYERPTELIGDNASKNNSLGESL